MRVVDDIEELPHGRHHWKEIQGVALRWRLDHQPGTDDRRRTLEPDRPLDVWKNTIDTQPNSEAPDAGGIENDPSRRSWLDAI